MRGIGIGLRTLSLGLLMFPAAALAAPGDPPVVRPQLYSAGNTFEITPAVGYVSNDPYYRIISPGIMLTYHYSDRSAFELHIATNVDSAKPLLNQVVQQVGHFPSVVSKPTAFGTLDYMWTPLYGKLDAFGEIVLHYDFYLLAGAGFGADDIQLSATGEAAPQGVPASQLNNSKSFPVVDVGLGQHFFFTRHVAARLEARPVIFLENVNSKEVFQEDVQINLGLTFLL